MQKLILASSSPRRLDILNKIGLNPEVMSPEIEEVKDKKESIIQYVTRLSQEKASSIYKNNADKFVIAADTVVFKHRKIFEKPNNAEEAFKMIETLKGGRHSVVTSYTIISPSGQQVTKYEVTKVLVKNMHKKEIDWYIQTNEWQGKSGGYAIQGLFEVFVKQINGSVSNVVGLPIHSVYSTLNGMGYKIINNSTL